MPESAVKPKIKLSLRESIARWWGGMDFSLLLAITVLCAFGLVMVFSASYYYAQRMGGATAHNPYYYLNKQVQFLVVGYVIMLAVSAIDFRILANLRWIIYLGSIALLIACVLFGKTYNGAKRWLDIGPIQLQPSEVAKFGLTIFMSAYMAKNRDRMAIPGLKKSGLIPMLFTMLFIAGPIVLQPNVSMAGIIAIQGLIMLFLGGTRKRWLVFLLGCGAAAFWLLTRTGYRAQRVGIFRNPFIDAQGSGYQLVQSFYALASGGWFGRGLNNSYQKLLYMTYAESDFIFPILVEEFGLVGGIGVLFCYSWIFARGVRSSLKVRDRFGSLLAMGISVVLGLQVFINIAVVTALMPPTGQALPFISSGGTSMLVFMAAMGVQLSISREANLYE